MMYRFCQKSFTINTLRIVVDTVNKHIDEYIAPFHKAALTGFVVL